MTKCNYCGKTNPDGMRFCIECGADLSAVNPDVCKACGTANPSGMKFCINCGAALGADVIAPTPSGNACKQCAKQNPLGMKFCISCGAALSAVAAAVTSTPKKVFYRKPTFLATAAGLVLALTGIGIFASMMDDGGQYVSSPPSRTETPTSSMSEKGAEIQAAANAIEDGEYVKLPELEETQSSTGDADQRSREEEAAAAIAEIQRLQENGEEEAPAAPGANNPGEATQAEKDYLREVYKGASSLSSDLNSESFSFDTIGMSTTYDGHWAYTSQWFDINTQTGKAYYCQDTKIVANGEVWPDFDSTLTWNGEWENGDFYYGYFSNDATGETWFGDFVGSGRNVLFHGDGTYTKPNGPRLKPTEYSGEWVNGVLNGYADIQNVDGDEDSRYRGEVMGWKYHGYGILTTRKTKQSGIWENGVLVKEIILDNENSSGSDSGSYSYDYDFGNDSGSSEGRNYLMEAQERVDQYRERLQKANDTWQAAQASKYD